MDLEHPNRDQYVRILIVEDDAMQAELLQLGLAAAGFRIDIVTNGLTAIEVVQGRRYDAVLVDYNIPEMDGFATARLLGDILGPTARPVLIALTATPERLTGREDGAASVFDLVLDKSCGLSSIILAIKHCLAPAPDIAAKRAARDLLDDEAEEDYFIGPQRRGGEGEVPGPVRILVVEDDEHQRLLLRTVLERRGYSVETASNGLEAVRRIREHCCDLAIVDYNLPEINGAVLASLVHDQMAQAWRPRLIALTATPDLLIERAAVTGPLFDQIIDKASGLDELIDAVDDLLRRSPDPETRRAMAHVLSRPVRLSGIEK
jgi:CheY-like chemotaxis protein